MIHLIEGACTMMSSWRLTTWNRVVHAFLASDCMKHSIRTYGADFATSVLTHIMRVIVLPLLGRPRVAVAIFVSLITI